MASKTLIVPLKLLFIYSNGLLIELLSDYDEKIKSIKPIYGKIRDGDIPHSIASIKKAKLLLKYNPTHNLKDGLKESITWYYDNLKIHE